MLIRSHRRAHRDLVIWSHVNGMGTAIEVHREEGAAVASAWVAGTGAVRPPAATQPLDHRPAHQRLLAQGPQLLAQPATAAGDLSAIRFHVCI